jgi:hypothetical protein
VRKDPICADAKNSFMGSVPFSVIELLLCGNTHDIVCTRFFAIIIRLSLPPNVRLRAKLFLSLTSYVSFTSSDLENLSQNTKFDQKHDNPTRLCPVTSTVPAKNTAYPVVFQDLWTVIMGKNCFLICDNV